MADCLDAFEDGELQGMMWHAIKAFDGCRLDREGLAAIGAQLQWSLNYRLRDLYLPQVIVSTYLIRGNKIEFKVKLRS